MYYPKDTSLVHVPVASARPPRVTAELLFLFNLSHHFSSTHFSSFSAFSVSREATIALLGYLAICNIP